MSLYETHEISDMAAKPRLSRRIAALSATAYSNSAGATAATASATSTESLAEEPTERVQGFQLARQKITQAAAIPATTQQRALPRSQEEWPRGTKCADASRTRDVRTGDEAK